MSGMPLAATVVILIADSIAACCPQMYASMNVMKLGQYAQELKDSPTGSGTIIVLIRLRLNQLTGELELDPTQDETDFVVMSDQTENSKFQLEKRGIREESKKVKVDYSLRALCEVMFLEPRMQIFIRGSRVQPVQVLEKLHDRKVVTINVPYVPRVARASSDSSNPSKVSKRAAKPVVAYIGRHLRHAEWQLSGTLIYQDNALVVSYGKDPEIPASIGNRQGVLLIASLPASEFGVHNTKTDFHSPRWPKIKIAFANEFKQYVDEFERHMGAASQEIAQQQFGATGGQVQTVNWMQCSTCSRWRVFCERPRPLTETLQRQGKTYTEKEFQEYEKIWEQRDWCCWFEGSPVQHANSPCDEPCDSLPARLDALLGDTTTAQVETKAPSWSNTFESDAENELIGSITSYELAYNQR
eukprot:COSAG02_NODE_6704_length_3411_cov_1.610507_3_plen_413_part_01